jgi:NAD(P)-dependent dehydrogenase (short-subunit alcohol dehydrogenase family)
MDNPCILITGSTDGIGRQCALELAKQGAAVIVHGRDATRARATTEEIKEKSGNDRVNFVAADFRSLAQVRQMAAQIVQEHSKLNILVNNAGTYERTRRLSEDGLEMTFAVNHLAPFLLTNLLLEILKRNAPAKIINVSSMAHQRARWDTSYLKGENHYDAYRTYAVSKLANLLFTYELAGRLEGTDIAVDALHPGVISTKLLRAGFGSFGGRDVHEGAARILHLINLSHDSSLSGKYFVDDTETNSSPQSRDPDLQKEFWSLSERLTGIIPA